MLEGPDTKEWVLIDKQFASAAEAVADIPDGASLAVGGFGLSGNPMTLIEALHAQGTGGLSVVSNKLSSPLLGWVGFAFFLVAAFLYFQWRRALHNVRKANETRTGADQ